MADQLPTYNAAEPAHPQENDWSCSQDSAEWALWAYGREPGDDWMEQSMMTAGVIDPAVGLCDASGAGLARWLNDNYGGPDDGFLSSNEPSVTFDDVAMEAAQGKHPLMIGGRAWGHWSGCRGYGSSSDLLMLANPADGWMGVSQTMDRQQFASLGPFSMVRLTHPAAEGQAPVPPTPPARDYDWWAADGKVGSGLLDMMRVDRVYPAQDWSTWLPLGRMPAQIEECIAEDGTVYRWLLGVNRGYSYRANGLSAT
jgi:hypothetical protein